MAFSEGPRGGFTPRAAELDGGVKRRRPNVAWAAFLTLVVAGPWLQPGYLFGTDWLGPRRFDWPNALSASVPLQAALALFSRVIGAEATGKLFVLAILFVAAFAAYAAVPADGFFPRAAGAALFVLNPFVFGRVHYGQLYLLAGYAVLPWAAVRLREVCARPGWKNGVWFGVSLSVVGVFTLHLLLVACFLSAFVVSASFLWAPAKLVFLRHMAGALLAAAGTGAVLCAYWLVPFVLGRSPEATVIGSTGVGQLDAYAAVPDANLGLVPNLVGLYGFWAENSGRFTSMKAFAPIWPEVLVGLLVVVAIGAVVGLARKGGELRPWVAGLVVAATLGVVLEMGVSHPLTAGFVRWLDGALPLYRGMRDAGKWAALTALVYSQLFGLGLGAIIAWIRRVKLPAVQSEWLVGAAMALLIAMPLYYGNGLLFGMHGSVKPSDYPAGWYAADRVLTSDAHPGRTLFLPWHQYMSLTFVKNQNSVIGPAALTFFSVPVLVSSNAEVPGVAAPTDPDQVAVTSLVSEGAAGSWAGVLASMNVKYVLLAREVDWKGYEFLDRQAGLSKVADFGTILLYRNSLMP